MKGYEVAGGYMGYMNGRYLLFVTEEEYFEAYEEEEEETA